VVAVGRSVLTIVWHLLNDPTARFEDLGADFYQTHTSHQRAKRNHVRLSTTAGNWDLAHIS
jgi:transposase